MTLLQAQKYELLNKWFASSQGLRASRAFVEELGKVSKHISGKNLLQLGVTGEVDLSIYMRFRNKIIISPSINIDAAKAYTNIELLPFDDNSFDCILAPFSMELFPNNQNIIAELDRVLKSFGFIIFWGINPCSFWGLYGALGKIREFSSFSLKLRSSLQLKKIFYLLGYSQIYLSSFYYIPPVNKRKCITNLEFLNQMGKMIWPYPAGFYCCILQKCEYGAHLICGEKEDIDFVFNPN